MANRGRNDYIGSRILGPQLLTYSLSDNHTKGMYNFKKVYEVDRLTHAPPFLT